MYLLKKFVSLGSIGKGSTVENGEEDSVEEESTSSSISSRSQSREESECNNNNNNKSDVGKKKKKRSRKRKKEEEDESSSSVSKNEIPEQFYDDLSETTESETKTTSEEMESSSGRKAMSSGDADFWTAAISGREEDSISKNENWIEDKKEGSEIEDIWADRENDDLPRKRVSFDEGDVKRDEKEGSPDSISDFWGDRDEDDVPRKKSVSREDDIWAEDDVPRRSISEGKDDPDEKSSPADVWGEDDLPRQSIPDKESSPEDIWADRNDEELPRKSSMLREGTPKEEDDKDDADAPRELTQNDDESFQNSKETTPTDQIRKKSSTEDEETPRKSESPPSDIWGDKEEDLPPLVLKPLNPEIVPCRKSDEFETFSETESSGKKDSTTESDKKESSSSSTSSDDEEDEPEPEPEPKAKSPSPEPSIPEPPPPPPPDFFAEKPVVRPYNDPEYRKAHRRSFVNVIKDVEQPRRRSVVLQESRERTSWKETKKESMSSSVDDGSDLEDLPDDAFVNYLGKENDKAEARLLARRQARVEAREIRLRELERQQKEQEENADKVFDMAYVPPESVVRTTRIAPTVLTPRERPISVTNCYHSSRRSSEDSIEDGYSLRDLRHEVKEIEEKFRKAMIANAQLDNEKSALSYQVELLKDKLEDMEESHAQLSREHRDKCREHEQLKRAAVKLKEDLAYCKYQLDERDRLIAEYGLVIVGGEGEDEEGSKRTLVSVQSAELLQQAGSGSLDVRLKKFAEERNELFDEVRHLKLELEEEKSKRASDGRSAYGSLSNGPLDEETSKLIGDYKFKLQKAEQDVSTLQANVARLESQVIRYKSAAETSEKAEDELKIEKRKLQRENRESIARIEELETANSHLQRRMDKLKNAKSTLLKEL